MTDVYVTKAMMANSPEECTHWVHVELCRSSASRLIMCPYSGRLMDTFTTVVIERTKDGASKYDALHADAWDGVAEAALAKYAELGWTVTVIDGRTLKNVRWDR